jgi:hypothetical protein
VFVDPSTADISVVDTRFGYDGSLGHHRVADTASRDRRRARL